MLMTKQRKPRREKDLESLLTEKEGETWRSQRKGNTMTPNQRHCASDHLCSPYFLLTVVLDAVNFSSSGSNQRLTTSARLEVYVILVLEYRQVCT